MALTTRTKIVRMGNSRGIRIPKLLLEEAGVGADVEITAEDGQIVVRPVADPRAGWDEAFKRMAELGDDKLLDDPCLTPTHFDEHEWEW